MHKRVHDIAFKKRAPKVIFPSNWLITKFTDSLKCEKGVKAVKEFAYRSMGTRDVRIDNELNAFLWSRGVKDVPRRVRVRLSSKNLPFFWEVSGMES